MAGNAPVTQVGTKVLFRGGVGYGHRALGSRMLFRGGGFWGHT